MKDYNFFEFFSDEKKSTTFKFAYVGILTGIIVGIMSITYIVNVFRISNLKSDIESQEILLKSEKFKVLLEKKNKEEKRLNILNDYYDKVVIANDIVSFNDKIESKIVKDISNTIPKEISFQVLSIDNETIHLQGQSSGRVPIAEFQHNLKDLSFIEDVYVSSITGNGKEKEVYSFNVICKLKEDVKDEINQ